MTIQRYFIGHDGCEIPHEHGNVVLVSDHLAAMQRERALAQIAVLEEMLEREMVSMRHDNDYRVRAVPQVSIINKIAALRKELER